MVASRYLAWSIVQARKEQWLAISDTLVKQKSMSGRGTLNQRHLERDRRLGPEFRLAGQISKGGRH
jgi:hypothetical protein